MWFLAWIFVGLVSRIIGVFCLKRSDEVETREYGAQYLTTWFFAVRIISEERGGWKEIII